ncbi:MAG TPA: TylF/MycF/NovP-related O-methyltransferase [Candidatus Saccharimonadales bacterium]|nr:TylF/MycF/NovP-related O-methyltransferase [Candidatus Saccharimonadales bacterium]
MSSESTVEVLLSHHRLISDQISLDQLRAILAELQKALALNGAVVEFGCYIGTTSLFIRRLLDAHRDNREFHVYDSFEGLPPKSPSDASGAGEQFQAGELAVSKKQFIQEFKKAGLRPPIIHKGWFSELTPVNIPDKIAFAFLDGDFYESIHDSLKLVLPRLVPGATIIIDDYAREALPGAARAVHELLPNKQIKTVHNLGIVKS